MRIRKNAKLSSLIFGQGGPPPSEVPSAYMCQLNQSPWDVIPFTSLPHMELDGEDLSFSGNGSWVNDPAGADSGMGAMMVVVDDIQVPKQDTSFNCNDTDDNDDNDNDNDNDGSGVSKVSSLAVNVGGCRKSNGKGWHCRKAPKEGHYLCDHHFKSQKTQNSGSAAGEVPGPRRRGRPPKNAAAAAAKSAGKSSSSSSNNQFYYYSGFGPLWGKHRNDKGATAAQGWPESLLEESSTPSSPYSLQIDGDGDDVVDEDDLSGDTSSSSSSSGGGSRKRTRKPVKARSLKSLM